MKKHVMERLRQETRNKTLEELIILAKNRGYTYPEKWAAKIMEIRARKVQS